MLRLCIVTAVLLVAFLLGRWTAPRAPEPVAPVIIDRTDYETAKAIRHAEAARAHRWEIEQRNTRSNIRGGRLVTP